MQGKSIVKFFAGFLLLVSAYQLMLSIPTSSIENSAAEYGVKMAAGVTDPIERSVAQTRFEQAYLDSASMKPALDLGVKSFTYDDLKKQQLGLGLDLKGGMSVVMQVNLQDFLIAMSNNSTDEAFQKAVAQARKDQESTQSDYLTLFVKRFKEYSNGKSLATIFAANPSLQDKIDISSTDEKVEQIIRAEAGETVQRTYELVKQRIDKFGVTSPNVQLDKTSDRITVELPGVKNPQRARNFLQSSAKLEFWEMYIGGEISSSLVKLNDQLKAKAAKVPMDSLGRPDSTALKQILEDSSNVGPLARAGISFGSDQGGRYAVVESSDTAKVMAMLSSPEARRTLPANAKFLLDRKPEVDANKQFTSKYALYCIKKRMGSDTAPLEGDHVTDASQDTDPTTGRVTVNLRLDDEGKGLWANMTGANVGRPVAVVIDDRVASAPTVNEKISGGNTQISGSFTIQDGQDLANILKIGKLPARTEIIEEAVVGPSLGSATIKSGLLSLVVGLLMVMAFMFGYYSIAGGIAVVALLANLIFIIASLASFGTVLTLPGIAGLALTMGMAVDANVIIYERVREGLRAGKGLGESINEGYSGSLSAIIDSNVTTIITSIILAIFGLGAIKGFGVVLTIGVLSSVFTAVLLSRLILEWWMGRGNNITFWNGATKDLLTGSHFDFVGKRKIGYMISGTIIVLGLVSMFVRGFELGVDLRGGRSYTVAFDASTKVNTEDLTAKLATSLKDAEGRGGSLVVKEFDKGNQVKIVTSFMQNSSESNADAIVLGKVREGIEAYVGKKLTDLDFSTNYLQAQNKVGATIADDLQNSAFLTSALALLGIFIYVFIRFQKVQFSMGAIIALIHDVLIVLSVFSIFHGILPFSLEVDQTFVAAILTVIGYSVNDTVIVFDRIREYLREYSHKPFKEVVNDAINNTLSRTLITSSTTLFVAAMLLFFGGDGIRGFALAITIGIIVGTYSSIFIATPIVVDLTKDGKGVAFEPEVPKSVETPA